SAEHRGLEVDQLYSQILGRTADAGGRAAFVNALLNGATEQDVAAQLFASGEYQAAHPSDPVFIAALYQQLLSRDPSNAEISGWVQALQNGLSRNAVIRAFLTSSEFYTNIILCDYKSLLNRDADAAGEQAWLSALTSGRMTLQNMTEAFLASGE